MRDKVYNYKLAKGAGLIDETLSLLSIFEKGMTKEYLAQIVHDTNILSKCTDKRSMDIVKIVFYPRYMKRNPNVPFWLTSIREKGLMLPQFKQLLMLYSMRDNAVVYDYVQKELNELKTMSKTSIPKDSVINFAKGLVEHNLASWGEPVIKRLAASLKCMLSDFDLIDKRGNILPYEASNFTILYLMHELHFAGLSDVAIWNHEDWQLFGLDKYQLQDRIMEQNIRGGYIAQCTGDLMTISWNYNSMEEFINGTL